jgi:hypothetical protein
MADATLILGRDGMGALATEEDFDAWVSFVAGEIDSATGLDVAVETRGARDVQDDEIRGCLGDAQPIRDALVSLWDEFCDRPEAWAVSP